MSWWELEIAVPASRWCATVAGLAGPLPGTGALLVRDVTAQGEPALYVQADAHDEAELTRWYHAAAPDGPPVTAVRAARLVPLAGPVFDGPALSALTRDLLHRAVPVVTHLAGLGADRRSALLPTALAMLTAHLAAPGTSAAPGAATMLLNGVPLGFLSFRSHAEAYFATCSDPDAVRARMDDRYRAAQAGIDAAVADALDQAQAGTLPDGPARWWHNAVTATRPDFLAAFRGATVTVSAPPDPVGHGNQLANSSFHRKAGDSAALQDFLRSDPAFLAVRLSTSLLYLALHTAGMSLAERYFACHLVSRACESISGTDAMTVLGALVGHDAPATRPEPGDMSTENSVPIYPFAAQCPFRQAPELTQLRRDAPVAEVRLPTGTTAFLVSGHREVRAVLGDERFSRRPARARAAGPNAPFDFGLFIADPADHERWRRITQQVFTVRQAEELRPAVGRIIDELLDDCAAATGPVDLIGRYCFPLPLRVLHLLFDVPAQVRPAFETWARSLLEAGSSMADFGAAMSELHTAALALVKLRRDRPGDDAVSQLIAAGNGMSDQDLSSTVLLVMVAGYESVATQLGNGLLALFQHPDELARLRGDEIAVSPAVEEILRYAQAGTGFAGMLYATTDIVLGDVAIPAGTPVFASTEAAGRDERRVPDPDRFDPSRGAAGNHLTFGSGAHFCLGAPLARVELQEGIGRLLSRFPGLDLAVAVADVEITGTRFNRLPAALPVDLTGPRAS